MKKQKQRPQCNICNGRLAGINYKDKETGIIRYRSSCKSCLQKAEHPYRNHKKTVCEKCGFVAEHSCQLDVDHIDGNHLNNCISNFQTLCANCHRLKTYTNKDYIKQL